MIGRASKRRQIPVSAAALVARRSGTKARTIRETAEILQVSERTVHRLIASGQLRAHRIVRLERITDDDISALLEASRIV